MSRKNYPTDLTDEEWSRIEELFQVSYVKGGRPLKHSKREISDAILTYEASPQIVKSITSWNWIVNPINSILKDY